MSHSHDAYLLGMKLDFQGILLLMWSSTVPLIYHSFPCHGALRVSYIAATTSLAVFCSLVTFLPRFSGPHLGQYRALLFGSFGLSSFVAPIAHGTVLYGLETQSQRVGLGWIAATVLCNGLGVLAYALSVSPSVAVEQKGRGIDGVNKPRSSQKNGFPDGLTFSEPAIRSCM